MPLAYSVVTSLKTKQQVSDISAPLLPALPENFTYQGREVPVVSVPLEAGTRKLALIKKGRQSSIFVDPQNPAAGEITWEGQLAHVETCLYSLTNMGKLS